MLSKTRVGVQEFGFLSARVVLMGASIGLIYWAGRWYDSFADSMVSTFSSDELWRWFLASALMVLAGASAGLTVRPAGYGRWRVAALAAVPFALAMSFPALVWGWPGTRMGSPLWSVLAEFSSDRSAPVLWLLVGLVVSGGLKVPVGFRPTREEVHAHVHP